MLNVFFHQLRTMRSGLQPTTYRLQANNGQALIEILIAFAISAIVIDVIVSSIAVVLKSNTQVKNFQIASSFGQELIDKTRIIAEAKWNDIYSLSPKNTSTNYFVIASGTGLAVIKGKEGVLGNDVRNGLVGNWKLDEATGTIAYDSSGNSNHGIIITGTSTINRLAGKSSDAINFDGVDDYVQTSSTAAITGDVTLMAWVYILSHCGASHCGVIEHRDQSEVMDYGMAVDTGGLRFNYFNGASWFDDGRGNIVTNRWSHIATVRNLTSNQINFYIDGSLVGNVSAIGAAGFYPNPVTIGTDYYGTISPLNGYIDDVRIYNRVLSAEEIKRVYDSGVFTRFFNVENVNRLGDDIVTSGGSDDPSTQKITSRVQWTAIDKTPEVKIATYLTRWRNFVFHQTDWSGGSGQDGPFTAPGAVFSTSTNTDYSGAPGSLKAQGF